MRHRLGSRLRIPDSQRQLAARGKSHAGGVTRPGADGVMRGRARNALTRSPRFFLRFFLRRPEAARNPSGDGRFFVPTAVMRARFFLRTRSQGADLAAHRDRRGDRLRSSALSFAFSFARRRSPGSPSSSLRVFSSFFLRSDHRSPPRFFLRTTGLLPRAVSLTPRRPQPRARPPETAARIPANRSLDHR